MKPRSPFRRARAGLGLVQAANASEPEILLYDEVGYWGVTAKDMKAELDTITAETIHLRVNSPGGDVFDGLAMHNMLRDHPARVVTHIDGLAASIASIVALAGDEVQIAENAFFMIHEPWTITIGDAKAHYKSGAVLDKLGGSLRDTYRNKSGATMEQIIAWMEEETWFNATEALDAGFVDSAGEPQDDALDDIAARFDLSIFAHTPERLLAAGLTAADPTTRDLEAALRDAGLSRVAAKLYVSAGRAAELQRDAGAPTQRDAESSPQGRSVSLADMHLLAAEL